MTSPPGAPELEVVEYTDPFCPWAWGSEPTFRRLRAALDGRARWRRVYGILFDDDDDPPPDPVAETAWYARYVERICGHTKAPHAPLLFRVAASSRPASLVAKAAEEQGSCVADRVLRRLRESMFVTGRPADTLGSALHAVESVPELEVERLRADAASDAVRERVRADRAEARRPVPEVLRIDSDSPHPGAAKEGSDGQLRYALPTLLFRTSGGRRVVPGWRPYDAYAAEVEELSPGLLPAAAPTLPAARALRHYRSLTGPESRALTSGPWPPPDAVRVDIPGGPLWFLTEEARSAPIYRPSAPGAS
ncbi:DsbA family protein [Streptomyces kunmingensis]|uniref:DsbA family protein n=1 Tax=Streptomyces kunmingensis TaxID=68225 RepID=A0ABU6CR59_9ACTN|nr:DsbA family protein [Streptomyces kunmingensis]MEB3967228.1 DsbA family protein [Streptomyces kunmingensis]